MQTSSTISILLDNCIPQRLAVTLDGFDVAVVADVGWARLTDRELLDAMTGRYDVLITVDRGIRHQQRLHDRPIAVVLLRATTNRLADLLPLVPELRRVLGEIKVGQVYEIGRRPLEIGKSPGA
jgi:predicted nuclease of predicted toxin-antitoxin system